MRIVLNAGVAPKLEEATDFRRFCIELGVGTPAGQPLDLASVLAPVAELDTSGHAWVRPDAIRALTPLSGSADWQQGFTAMIGFAAKHGWLDVQGRIRAHVGAPAVPAPVPADAFRSAMRRFASGVCVVATGEGDERCGMTVSAFSSVSADPPLVLVCLNRAATAHDRLTGATQYSINILDAGQTEVAMTFAGQRGLRGAERFSCDWDQRIGTPVLTGAHQSLICVPTARHVAGSHTVLIGTVIHTTSSAEGTALLNYDGQMMPTICAA
ncbi:flavin reductase family protein [Mesorhizobium xinjiangense]|uniref:flavin reductase family protein n=1 Tax=Mesorhizobium xinjiangense TaxID=2678685 RepID=UPI0012EEB41F|nr:flavin reductase family protein [Mesorhizobium xinjiangense]